MLNEPERNTLIQYCKDHEISYMGIFGSATKNEDSQESDIDILVRYGKPVGLLRHAAIQRHLSELLNRPVDLVTENSLSPYLKDEILNSTKMIYDEAG